MKEMKCIEILGPGCSRCQSVEKVVRQVVEDLDLKTEVRKTGEIERMLELGVMATPAIAIDGEVKMVGKVPKPAEVRQLLGVED